MLNGADVNYFVFYVTRVWYKVSRFEFLGGCFSIYFKNQNIYLKKHAFEAAKSNRLGSRHAKNPHSKDLFIKMLQNWVNCKSTKAISEQCFSCQNKSVCQKSAWTYKKWKYDQKAMCLLGRQGTWALQAQQEVSMATCKWEPPLQTTVNWHSCCN